MDGTDRDPVTELHEIRRKLYKDAGGTPEAYVRYLMEQQKQYGDRLVNFGKPSAAKAGACRKQAKPAAKPSARKQGRRRRTVTA